MGSGGLHLVMDGETAAPLGVDQIERFLWDFPSLIGLHRITEPMVKAQEGGHCGIVVMAESHISVHTRGSQVWVDVFSCIGFSRGTEWVTQAVARLLVLERWRATTLQRPMPPVIPQAVMSL